MSLTNQTALENTPVTQRIAQRHNNRLGAVYSSLYAFWTARTSSKNRENTESDAYSIILFNHRVQVIMENDHTSPPDELLNIVLEHGPQGGTDFFSAVQIAQAIMENNWDEERYDRDE